MTVRQRAVILHGVTEPDPTPDEADVFDQIAVVEAGLAQLGYESAVTAVASDLATILDLRMQEYDLAVNLVEAIARQDRLAMAAALALEVIGVPFTGASSTALALTNDKLAAKHVMRLAGLPTPEVLVAGAASPGSWIVKSVTEHGSKAIDDAAVVAAKDVAKAIADRHLRYGGAWFAERFIDGREFNLSILDGGEGPQVLPPAEMLFVDFPAEKPRIVGYGAKWDAGDAAYHNTPRRFAFGPEDVDLIERLTALALTAWDVFGLTGYARVDFRVERGGMPYVLEINANPCLSADAGFMAAASQAGLTPDDVIARIVEAAHVPHS